MTVVQSGVQDSLKGTEIPTIRYQRHLPKRGPPGWVWLLGGLSIIGFGIDRSIKGRNIVRELRRENIQGRLHLLPLLTFEEDLQYLHTLYNDILLESKIMGKAVENGKWSVGESVYHTEEFVPRRFFLPKSQ